MPLDDREAREALLRQPGERFAPADVLDLSVSPERDHDGDPILRLRAALRSADDRLDPKRVVGLIRHLRAVPAERGEDRSPIAEFRTEREAAEIAREAR